MTLTCITIETNTFSSERPVLIDWSIFSTMMTMERERDKKAFFFVFVLASHFILCRQLGR